MSAVALLGRTSERDDSGTGARELGELLGAQMVGEVDPPRVGRWDEDLVSSRPVLDAARAAIQSGASTLISGHCAIAIVTLPAIAARVPDVKIAWLDAHPDFNTPETSASGFLGGMPLAAACGIWSHPTLAGLADPPVDPARVHLVGIRDVDPGERELVAAHGLQEGPPDEGPVFVHLDLDILDNALMPAGFPAPGGWTWEQLGDTLAALPDVVGIEITGCAPGHAQRVAELLPAL